PYPRHAQRAHRRRGGGRPDDRRRDRRAGDGCDIEGGRLDGGARMTDTTANKTARRSLGDIDLRAVAPFVALALLLVLGSFVNPNFLGFDNLSNVLTRSAFIAVIAVGATFVISAGGLDLSVGSMVAFVASLTIMFLNSGLIGN